jgi:hypothetical protein
VALIGCGRSKLQHPAPAARLYTGSLFRQALAFTEGRFDERYILSARYELVALDQVLHPYDLDLRSMRLREREAWGSRVAGRLEALFTGLQVELTFLCGHEYAAHVRWNLPRIWSVVEPLRGLPLGRRLAVLSGHQLPVSRVAVF